MGRIRDLLTGRSRKRRLDSSPARRDDGDDTILPTAVALGLFDPVDTDIKRGNDSKHDTPQPETTHYYGRDFHGSHSPSYRDDSSSYHDHSSSSSHHDSGSHSSWGGGDSGGGHSGGGDSGGGGGGD